jgi:hypothetical protein
MRHGRPRLVFDIAPSKKHWYNLYNVYLKNAGGSPAYNITCIFDPDLPYAKDLALGTLPIFRRLNHIVQGDDITFFSIMR